MKDLAIAIVVGSPTATIKLVENTFSSINKNIGSCDWKVFLCLGLNIPIKVNVFVKEYVENHKSNFEIIKEDEVSWATFANEVIDLTND